MICIILQLEWGESNDLIEYRWSNKLTYLSFCYIKRGKEKYINTDKFFLLISNFINKNTLEEQPSNRTGHTATTSTLEERLQNTAYCPIANKYTPPNSEICRAPCHYNNTKQINNYQQTLLKAHTNVVEDIFHPLQRVLDTGLQ